ncbi:hydrogenase maturation nickel metallochaperone HypA [Burkholderia sp. LA-2-3-30-S1-D2]|uniref:hydrogenase maturation nickel metallochaperone HypA n=1 Tax=Burkholderia sp. LA-2-3-30-S1-D2 TaxID=1637862 RepID=UPI00075F587B|nr:hydrogenase maturation nickel metallochaperone HypA [Burkholderia sp. LA-2-3-30-S1-D2]AOI95241.1 hydrogenase nickel incorporation protein HypA [Burkholderia sp. LA-2-3-30-S1-D2]KVE19563.1 hydrogenase nickel incorporation protein HypA [Burkholderia sp. LA-2-3-30-S1-D2]
MHETGIVRNLVHRLETAAQENGAVRINGVEVWLGALCQFSPEHFREHFVDEACGTLAEGATLRIEVSQDLHHPHAQDVMMTAMEFDVPDGEG